MFPYKSRLGQETFCPEEELHGLIKKYPFTDIENTVVAQTIYDNSNWQ